MMPHPDSATAAWAAGLFEGEGWITKTPHRGQFWHIGVKMTDEDVLLRLCRAVGCGSVTGPYGRPNPEHKPFWVWGVTARADVVRTLSLFLPYLGKRRGARAREAIAAARQGLAMVTERRTARAYTATHGRWHVRGGKPCNCPAISIDQNERR